MACIIDQTKNSDREICWGRGDADAKLFVLQNSAGVAQAVPGGATYVMSINAEKNPTGAPLFSMTGSVVNAPGVLERERGEVAIDHIGIWEADGVDYTDVFRGLNGIGYRAYVTVHQAFAGIMPIETAVKRSADYLRPLVRAQARQ